MLNASVDNISSHTSGRKHGVESSEPNDNAGKRTMPTWPLSQNDLSCICVEMVKCDIDAIPSTCVTLLRCIHTKCICTLSIGCSDPCSRLVLSITYAVR